MLRRPSPLTAKPGCPVIRSVASPLLVQKAARGFLWLGIVLNTCAPGAAARTATTTHISSAKADTVDCQLPLGWSAIQAKRPRYIVFGELHGTQQSPAFVRNLACALAKSGKKVLVAVELDASLLSTFDYAWAQPHDAFATTLLSKGWAGRQDGVASTAMLDMISDLHRLSKRGHRVRVVPFNGPRDEDQRARLATLAAQNAHEASQAENIVRTSRARHYDYTLVLVGGLHASKQPVVLQRITVDPMARRLAKHGRVVSLKMRSAGGTAWVCQLRPGALISAEGPKPADVTCGNSPVKADPNSAPVGTLWLRQSADERTEDYDGFYSLATAKALGVLNRFDPAANISGAASYLRQMLDRFGRVHLALAAYNAGPSAVARAGGIPQNGETPKYVTRVLSNWQF